MDVAASLLGLLYAAPIAGAVAGIGGRARRRPRSRCIRLSHGGIEGGLYGGLGGGLSKGDRPIGRWNR